ncbi:GntR family transcriptional regulator [Microbacterium barkeri]|uniref:GntR family transcriptional regulator n=1 Tax=Microbacterium barkeri TaxID=33917 RepID=A0A9W6LWL4_9MICO|nr:FCD domain-containing protein [Microbacterium barkeri]MDR6878104.1 DNA-binding FadR family transcriptional regulator [Microbacterium barkeri]GLJ61511.1 GntR family transcriptional regulator [Microbacterium barkeri]
MPLNAPIRQAPLVVQVTEQFRALIVSGAWPVGSRIPGEIQLAEDLDVSRGTVREALRALSVAGLLEPRVGDGTYVRASDELPVLLARDTVSIDHVFEARAGLEAAAARAAAAIPETAGPAIERALVERMRAHEAGDLDACVAADAAFHRAVIEASGNPLLARLHEAMAGLVTHSIAETSALPEPREVGDAHRALADAIARGDRDAAGALAASLIDTVRATAAP